MCLGVPAEVVKLLDNYQAVVDVDQNVVEISILMTPDVEIGQYVLVHAGFAMEIIEEGYAKETMSLLREVQSIRESHQYEQ